MESARLKLITSFAISLHAFFEQKSLLEAESKSHPSIKLIDLSIKLIEIDMEITGITKEEVFAQIDFLFDERITPSH